MAANPQQMRAYLTGTLGYSPTQAAALLGNIQQESSFDPNNFNKGEGAYGLVQWRGDRLTGLQNFAQQRGTSPSDWQTQLAYIRQEMSGPEAQNSTGFMSAQDLPSANAALKQYIRYGDNSQGARLGYANSFLGGDTQAAPSYSDTFNKPELVPGALAPPLPPPITIDGQPQQGMLAGNLPFGLGSPQSQQQQGQGMGGLLGMNSPQSASADNGLMSGTPLDLLGNETAPKQKIDLSSLMKFLASANRPTSWGA